MGIKTKQAYGNGQLVTRRMVLALGKLRVMCDKYDLWLVVFVDEYTSGMPIVLIIYDGFLIPANFKLYNEEELLGCVSEQLVMLDAKYKS